MQKETTINGLLVEGLKRYVEQGIRCGDFLNAILENDLETACAHADFQNAHQINEIMHYVREHVPPTMRGSEELVRGHIAAHKGEAERLVTLRDRVKRLKELAPKLMSKGKEALTEEEQEFVQTCFEASEKSMSRAADNEALSAMLWHVNAHGHALGMPETWFLGKSGDEYSLVANIKDAYGPACLFRGSHAHVSGFGHGLLTAYKFMMMNRITFAEGETLQVAAQRLDDAIRRAFKEGKDDLLTQIVRDGDLSRLLKSKERPDEKGQEG